MTRSSAPRVSVVIPAMNEAQNLPYVLGGLSEEIDEVILVDGHSTDGTTTVARVSYPTVNIVGQTGRGKGDALTAGFAAATGDVVVAMDADGSMDPEEISRFVAALCDGADLVKGSRFVEGGGSDDLTLIRRLGNAFLCGLFNVMFGARHSDLCYGYFAFWADCLPALHTDCDGFEVETMIAIRAAQARLDVCEVPSFESPRRFGESNLRAVRDGLRILRAIFRERFRRTHVVNSVQELPAETLV
jgi:glycosyltransferase involved in cell wall biosynthesis